MLFGCCIPTAQYLEAVAVGADFVEFSCCEIINMPEEKFSKLCAQVQGGPISCLAFNNYCNKGLTIAGHPEESTRIAEYAKRVCERAQRIGAKTVGIGAPEARKIPESYDLELADRQCVEFLRITADIAKKFGIIIDFEQLHQYKCNYCNSTESAVELVRKAQRANISLVVDFYHRKVMREPVSDLYKVKDLIHHTHISTCGETYERGYPDITNLAEYTEILAELKKVGYNGTMSIEAPADDLLRVGKAALEMLRSAERSLR